MPRTSSILPQLLAAVLAVAFCLVPSNTRAADPASPKKKSRSGGLSPADSFAKMKTPDDLQLKQLLSEPRIAQPVFLNFDHRGRMWVVEYRQYPHPAGLKLVSRDNYWRAVYDKVPAAPPNHVRGADRITIHEDTNGDGKYDRHKTFVDGLNIATSCVVGRGGVWVLNPPYLLFYPDKNGDDVPDGDPIVHLSGFGLEDTHSVVNSLCWGPDGWLYAAQGSTVTANVLRAGLDKKPTYSQGQLVWRYHPRSRRYEIFAEGGGNAFGIAIDRKGRIFSGHNGGNTRGFHYPQGGYLRKGFSKHGPLSNPYAFGFFKSMRHPNVPRFTHTFVIYDGGALSEKYDGHLFGVEPLQGRVVQSLLSRDGSSFQTKDVAHPITSGDKWFRPVDIKVGPDGAIYVADWYDGQVNHYLNHEGQVDPKSGRIYRLSAREAKPQKTPDLSRLVSSELVGLLSHKNIWYRRMALRLLGDRRDASVIPQLRKMIARGQGQLALESLWALNLSGGLTPPVAEKLLSHDDPFVRLWTVRILCDEKKVSRPIAARLIRLAREEKHVEVRSQLACSARRLTAADCLSITSGLLTHREDVTDIHLPLLLWWAIESKCSNDSTAVLKSFSEKEIWLHKMTQQHILARLMRRFAQAGSRSDLLICAALLKQAPDANCRRILMKGLEQAFRGRPLSGLPIELSRQMALVGGASLALRVRQKDAKAVAKALSMVADSKAKKTRRLELIAVFGQVKLTDCVPALLDLLKKTDDADLQRATLSTLQSYQDGKINELVITRFADLSVDVRGVALSLLVSRATSARRLIAAVKKEQIENKMIPRSAVFRLRQFVEPDIAADTIKLWGDGGATSPAKLQREIERLRGVIHAKNGSPYEGKKLFQKTCAKCHRLFEHGGKIGPDLTVYKRDDLPGMLLSIINPSAEIREGFENYQIATEDGQRLSGFLVERDNRVVVLKGEDGQNVVLQVDEIDQMRVVPVSLMPEGLLKNLTDQQIRDLFAYLRSTQPLNN